MEKKQIQKKLLNENVLISATSFGNFKQACYSRDYSRLGRLPKGVQRTFQDYWCNIFYTMLPPGLQHKGAEGVCNIRKYKSYDVRNF